MKNYFQGHAYQTEVILLTIKRSWKGTKNPAVFIILPAFA